MQEHWTAKFRYDEIKILPWNKDLYSAQYLLSVALILTFQMANKLFN